MALRIIKIYIENFKVFEKKYFDFENADLILFDGPNGFGKSSFYDSIELLLSGSIRRYQALGDAIIDGRVAQSENPYLNKNHPEGDIIIRGEIKTQTQTVFFERILVNSQIDASYQFDKFKLYQIDNIKGDNRRQITEEEFSDILGEKMGAYFNFVNYVEQEESLFLLKQKSRKKETDISFLFNAEAYDREKEILNKIKSQVRQLCNSSASGDIEQKKSALALAKGKFIAQENCDYSELISQNFIWDKEQILFDGPLAEELKNSWIGADGLLLNLKYLITHKEDFKAYNRNNDLSNLLQDNDLIEQFIRFFYYRNNISKYKEVVLEASLINRIIGHIDAISVDTINSDNYLFTSDIFSMVPDELLALYSTSLDSLKKKKRNLSDTNLIISSLLDARDNFKSKYEKYKKDEVVKDCPLCGKEWLSAAELSMAVESQTVKMKSILDNNSKEFEIQFNSFKVGILSQLRNELLVYRETLPIDFAQTIHKVDFLQLDKYANDLAKFNISFEELLCKNQGDDIITLINKLKKQVRDQIKEVDTNVDFKLLKEIFSELFGTNKEKFDLITIDQIDNKIRYINWQYALSQSKGINELEKSYLSAKEKFDLAKKYDSKIQKIQNIYEISYKRYKENIIKDIELLFHLYSARIVQDYQGGLGLFLTSDRNGLSFVTQPDNSFDAIFTMSSGQLSALIISFTLALNKMYSSNKLLFIDDPVQTMDEINISNFIELLRNEFGDRQIFLSTHENEMSTFIRYKFNKFGFKTKRINLRES